MSHTTKISLELNCPYLYFILKSRTYIKELYIFVLQISKFMTDTRLGHFEEVLLLLVGILGEEAYSFNIAKEFEIQTGRGVSIGAVHSTLNRLEKKNFLSSEKGASTAERGGKRKRIFSMTAHGRNVLNNSKDIKVSLWKQYPGFIAREESIKLLFR